ncbi:MAG: universal stress protein [Solirubrobacteraceae bacterium]
MTPFLIALVVVLAAALVGLVVRQTRISRPTPRTVGEGSRRILFPFAGSALSRRALDAALRLARAEDAVLVPVFLARVPLHMPLETPLPRQADIANALQEAIEQRAAAFGVPVDARIERGRTYRHALRQTIDHERYDRIVLAGAAHGGDGFDPDDVAWLLDNAEGEIVVLRPSSDDRFEVLPARSQRRARPRRRSAAGAPRGPAGEHQSSPLRLIGSRRAARA